MENIQQQPSPIEQAAFIDDIFKSTNRVASTMRRLVLNDEFKKRAPNTVKWWINLLNFRDKAQVRGRDWSIAQRQLISKDFEKHCVFLMSIRKVRVQEQPVVQESAPADDTLSQEDAEYAERLAAADAAE